MAIYLKFGNVKGNVTANGYAGQIALNTVHFKVSRKVAMEPGNLSNRESTKPAVSVVTITKDADSSVVALFKEALAGSAGQEAIITFVHTGTDKVREFMTYKLKDCIVSDYDFSAEKEGVPTEIIKLSFSAIEASYKDHDASNKSGNPQRTAYDLKTAKVA